MKNLRAVAIFLLAVLLFSSAGEMITRAEAGRCLDVLDPSSCELSSCRQQCFEKHNGNGVCEANASEDQYRCACFYNC